MTAYTKNSAGAPIGNYIKGDTCTDSEGTVWNCVVTGNPAVFDVDVDEQGGGPQLSEINTNTALLAADSGSFYVVTANAEIDLPAAAVGLWYRFYVRGASIAVTIDAAGTDTLTGGYFSSGDSMYHVINAASNHQVGNGDANAGDWIDVACVAAGLWTIVGFTRSWAT
jgi:hypothetical protein